MNIRVTHRVSRDDAIDALLDHYMKQPVDIAALTRQLPHVPRDKRWGNVGKHQNRYQSAADELRPQVAVTSKSKLKDLLRDAVWAEGSTLWTMNEGLGAVHRHLLTIIAESNLAQLYPDGFPD